MAAIDAKFVKDIAPELASEPNKRINIFINMATNCVNETVWGDKCPDAVALLTAHFMTMANRGGVGGAVKSEKVGDLSTTYGSSANEQSLLAQTSYGSMFLQMMRVVRPLPRVLGKCH
jgi:hypothetical protein